MTTENHTSKPITHPHVKIIRHIVTEPIEVKTNHGGDAFHKVSQTVSTKLGSPLAFALAVLLIALWIVTGPFFNFSDTWQLVINTTTTIITFLMVFAIQNTQNRDSKAMQLKLDELIKSSHGARTEFVDIEDLTDTELDILHIQFKDLHDKFNNRVNKP
jgi:low affinity Fe/Cu permease